MKLYKSIVLVVLLLLISSFFVGCTKEKTTKATDYSDYPFTDISWTRKAENDTETLRFSSDGSYVYYCSCGNPVNDSDLNEGYTYNDKTKVITISYVETTDETVSEIKIEKCTDSVLKLNFNGEIREFEKSKN